MYSFHLSPMLCIHIGSFYFNLIFFWKCLFFKAKSYVSQDVPKVLISCLFQRNLSNIHNSFWRYISGFGMTQLQVNDL